jgi:hypothetical protein
MNMKETWEKLLASDEFKEHWTMLEKRAYADAKEKGIPLHRVESQLNSQYEKLLQLAASDAQRDNDREDS